MTHVQYLRIIQWHVICMRRAVVSETINIYQTFQKQSTLTLFAPERGRKSCVKVANLRKTLVQR